MKLLKLVRRMFAAALFLGHLVFVGPLYAETSVWKVSRGDNELFIGGTVHVLSKDDFPLPDVYDKVYDRVDKLILETDLQAAQSPEFQAILMQKAVYTGGKNLGTELSPETFQALQAYTAEAGIPLENFMIFKPGMLSVMLTMIELNKLGLGNAGVDQYYFDKAVADKKTMGELESMESQIDLIANMGVGREDEFIAYTLNDMKELPTMIGLMVDAWRVGDLEKLDEIAGTPLRAKFPEMYKQLLLDRNNAWMQQIEAMLNTPEVELVLVGCLHVAGEDGLIEQLSKKGYEIVQM